MNRPIDSSSRKRLIALIIALAVIVVAYCQHSRARRRDDYRSMLNGEAPIKSMTFDGQQRHIFVDDPQIMADFENDFRTGHTVFPLGAGYLTYHTEIVLKSGVKIDTVVGLYKFGYPLFTWDDIKNSSNFVSRLKLHPDLVSGFLFQKMLNYQGGVLTNWEWFGETKYEGQNAVYSALNEVIRGPSIYESKRFHDIPLRSETIKLMQNNPTGTNLTILNRMLIEDAYPLELSSNHKVWNGFQIADFTHAASGDPRWIDVELAPNASEKTKELITKLWDAVAP